MRTNQIIFLIIIIFLNSCGFEKIGEWNISELYVQKIEGTSKVIYKYNAWGGRDSNANGFVIMDSTEKFKIDMNKELPFYYLSQIPNKKNVEGVTHECYGTCGEPYYKSLPIFKPMEVKSDFENGIKITTRIYQYKGYSEHDRGLERYVFEKYKETRDSLYFYNLDDVESMDGIHLDELKVKKGEVYLSSNANKEIEKIFVDDVALNPKTNSIEQIRHIHLTPKNKLIDTEISEIGIFREIKKSK
ncbi:hypothetical protein [Soonwooa purpurea]